MKKFWLWGGIGGVLSFVLPPTIFFGAGTIAIWAESIRSFGFERLDAEFLIIICVVLNFIIGAVLGLLIGRIIKNPSVGKTISVVMLVYLILFLFSAFVLPKVNNNLTESRLNDLLVLKSRIQGGTGSIEQIKDECDSLGRDYAALCIEELALREKDPLLCRYDRARVAYGGWNCISKVFKNNPSLNDLSLCDSFSNTNDRDACIQGVAINRLDSSLCRNAGYNRQQCIMLVEDLKSKSQ